MKELTKKEWENLEFPEELLGKLTNDKIEAIVKLGYKYDTIDELDLDWSLLNKNSDILSLFDQLQKSSVNYLNVKESDYLNTILGTLYNSTVRINDFIDVYCGRELFDTIVNNYMGIFKFETSIPVKMWGIEHYPIRLQCKEEIPNDYVVCLSLNSELNIYKINNKDEVYYCLINPNNALLINFKK